MLLITLTTITAAADPDPALREQLARLDERIAEIEDLTVDFEQRKFTPLLREPLTSTGRVLVKGDRSRWETAEPHPSVALIDPERVRVYYPEQKTLEIYDLGDRLREAVTTPLPRFEDLLQRFDIQRSEDTVAPSNEEDHDHTLRLILTPRGEDLREHVRRIVVTVNTESALAEHVEWTDPDGERTAMIFTNPRINRGLTEETLDLDLPDGTNVVRPLEEIER